MSIAFLVSSILRVRSTPVRSGRSADDPDGDQESCLLNSKLDTGVRFTQYTNFDLEDGNCKVELFGSVEVALRLVGRSRVPVDASSMGLLLARLQTSGTASYRC